MKLLLVLLVLSQLIQHSAAAALRVNDGDMSERRDYEAALKSLFPLPVFKPLSDRPPRQGAVQRFNSFGPACGHLRNLESEECVCCGTVEENTCFETTASIDYCELSEVVQSIEKNVIKPTKADYRLPSDFPDIKKFFSF
ncbi:unnamed protein product [Caenorhabditis brenneri]